MLESFVHISKIFTKMRKTCLFKVYWKHPLWVFAWAAAWQYWRCLQVSDWKWETWLNIFSFFGGMWSSVSLNSVNAQLKFRFLADISLLVPENDFNHFSSEQQNQRACQFWDFELTYFGLVKNCTMPFFCSLGVRRESEGISGGLE